jgi:hypothetical protein
MVWCSQSINVFNLYSYRSDFNLVLRNRNNDDQKGFNFCLHRSNNHISLGLKDSLKETR